MGQSALRSSLDGQVENAKMLGLHLSSTTNHPADERRSVKRCWECQRTLPIERFQVDRSRRDGLCAICKECARVRRAAYREKNREKENALARVWAKRHRPYLRVQGRLYYQANSARLGPMKLAARNNRKARIRGAGGTHTAVEWQALCEFYGNVCLCCRRERPLARDHVIPVSKGGGSGIENLQPLCASCNSKKGDRAIDFRLRANNFMSSP